MRLKVWFDDHYADSSLCPLWGSTPHLQRRRLHRSVDYQKTERIRHISSPELTVEAYCIVFGPEMCRAYNVIEALMVVNYGFVINHQIIIINYQSSIGRVFRSPLRSEEENGGPSASGGHLGWPHFRFPQMRSPKMATGSGRAAIFLLTPQWGSKNAPQVLDDVISGAAILDSRWRWWKWRLEDVETPVKTSYRRLPHPWVL